MALTRRGLAGVLAGMLAAPAIIRTPGLLMPVKRVAPMPVKILESGATSFLLPQFRETMVVINRSKQPVMVYDPNGGRGPSWVVYADPLYS